MRRWAGLCGRATALCVAAFAGALPAAADARLVSVALFSDPGDYYGAGRQHLFGPRNARFEIRDQSGLGLTVRERHSGTTWDLVFGARGGLHEGVYDWAGYTGNPNLDTSGDGRGCLGSGGRFEVLDLARSRSGRIRRAWIVFENHCYWSPHAQFGEVLIGKRLPAVRPRLVRWAEGEAGRNGTAVPVTFRAPAKTRVASTAVVGAGRAAFPILRDGCTHRTVRRGDSCRVWVRFVAGAGTHAARVAVTSRAGRRYFGRLQGFNWGGTTKLEMHSDEGDWLGQGGDLLYTPAEGWFFDPNLGRLRAAPFTVNNAVYDSWDVRLRPRAGDVLRAGRTYTNARNWASSAKVPGLEVFGMGRGCNEYVGRFHVTDARTDSHGYLRHFGATFETHCEGRAPALRGEMDFRAGDHTRPPHWIRK